MLIVPAKKSHLKNCAQKLPANQLHEIFVAFVDWCHLGKVDTIGSYRIPWSSSFCQGGSSSFYVTRRRREISNGCFSLSWCVFPCWNHHKSPNLRTILLNVDQGQKWSNRKNMWPLAEDDPNKNASGPSWNRGAVCVCRSFFLRPNRWRDERGNIW